MNNIEHIDRYISSISNDVRLLKLARSDYKLLKHDLLENGSYQDRPRCTYTEEELNYAIKLINLKLNILKNKN